MVVEGETMSRFSLDAMPSEPWKNGGGTTRVLCGKNNPDADVGFDWRMSVADIADSGPFSTFAGVDRIAVVLENGPLKLSGLAARLLPVAALYHPVTFSGELDVFATVPGDRVLCLNVMTRRGAFVAEVDVVFIETVLDSGPERIVFATGAGWQVDSMTLGHYAGLRMHSDTGCVLRPPPRLNGPLIVVSLYPA